MDMTLEQIGGMISAFIEIGRMQAVKAYEPTADMIRAAELETWCKATGTDWRKVRVLIGRGVIAKRRMGTGKNSPLVYSKEEVKREVAKAGIASEMFMALDAATMKRAARLRQAAGE